MDRDMPDTNKTSDPAVEQGIPPESISEQMDRILADADFARSERCVSLLRFVVAETLAGRSESISPYRIGREVLDRDEDFNPNYDPIVRNQTGRLRRALERYYFRTGANDPIVIDLPKGGCVPTFSIAGGATGRAQGGLVDSAAYDLPTGPSIAVLPFVNLDGNPDQDFFADGLSEELIVELSRFQDFFVVGRQSTLKYRGSDIDLREVGRDLDVRYVLTGTVIRSTLRLRVSVKLSDTRTGGLLWADRFESELAVPDIFDLHDRISSEVVSKVADNFGVIPRALAKASSRKGTNELSSYETILRFHHYVASFSKEALQGARDAVERAVQRDPEYVPALAKLSEILCDAYMFGYSDEPDLVDRAMGYATRAVSLDPESQDAHVALMWCHYQRRNRADLLAAAARVIELNPNLAYPVGFAGYCMALVGEWNEGLALVDKALRLNPYNPGWLLKPRYADHLRSAEYEEALEIARKLDRPTSELRLTAEAAALGHLGRAADGERTIARLLELHPGFDGRAATYIHRLIFLEEIADLMLEGLQKAGFTPGDL
jgi:TolB-like protein